MQGLLVLPEALDDAGPRLRHDLASSCARVVTAATATSSSRTRTTVSIGSPPLSSSFLPRRRAGRRVSPPAGARGARGRSRPRSAAPPRSPPPRSGALVVGARRPQVAAQGHLPRVVAVIACSTTARCPRSVLRPGRAPARRAAGAPATGRTSASMADGAAGGEQGLREERRAQERGDHADDRADGEHDQHEVEAEHLQPPTPSAAASHPAQPLVAPASPYADPTRGRASGGEPTPRAAAGRPPAVLARHDQRQAERRREVRLGDDVLDEARVDHPALRAAAARG